MFYPKHEPIVKFCVGDTSGTSRLLNDFLRTIDYAFFVPHKLSYREKVLATPYSEAPAPIFTITSSKTNLTFWHYSIHKKTLFEGSFRRVKLHLKT